VTAIEIATGEAAISFDADRDGALRQLGFRLRPPGELRIDRGLFPPEAFPLAYPAWGQDVSQPPATTGGKPAIRRWRGTSTAPTSTGSGWPTTSWR